MTLFILVTGPGPGVLFSNEKFEMRRAEFAHAPARERLRPSELQRRYQTETQAELAGVPNGRIQFGESQITLNVQGRLTFVNFNCQFSNDFQFMINLNRKYSSGH